MTTKLKEKKIKGVKGFALIHKDSIVGYYVYLDKQKAKLEKMRWNKIIPVLITPLKGRKISQIKKK